jgi:hypothetical protein
MLRLVLQLDIRAIIRLICLIRTKTTVWPFDLDGYIAQSQQTPSGLRERLFSFSGSVTHLHQAVHTNDDPSNRIKSHSLVQARQGP